MKDWATTFDRTTLVWTARLGDQEAAGITERIVKTALGNKLEALRVQLVQLSAAA